MAKPQANGGKAKIKELQKELEALPDLDSGKLDQLLKSARTVIRTNFEKDHPSLKELDDIRFYPPVQWAGMSRELYLDRWNSGKQELANVFKALLEEIDSFAEAEEEFEKLTKDAAKTRENEKKGGRGLSKNVFIVHGHNEEMKVSMKAYLLQLGLKPIIGHEQANRGRTLVQKMLDSADRDIIGFAVVLLSGDDLGRSKREEDAPLRPRARQNVIFELGLFLGALGPGRVIALYEQTPGFETPSDYQGVLYIPYDRGDTWKVAVAREFKAGGLDIDLNLLFSDMGI